MSTTRFRNLNSTAASEVVKAFLGGESSVNFTEKLAGQHFSALLNPDGSVQYSVKSGRDGGPKGGYFPTIEKVLENNHPAVSSPVSYSFEILSKSKRPDYIDYDLSHDVNVVEYSGNMTPETADTLNAAQQDIFFMTRRDIHRDVAGVSLSSSERKTLEDFVSTADVGKPSRLQYDEVESLLSRLVDRGAAPSSLGGKRIEGLFGSADDVGFKIPSKAYAEVQLVQSKFYALVKKYDAMTLKKRFDAAAGRPQDDRIVQDLLDYVDLLEKNPPPTGFRVFFAKEELKLLRHLANRLILGDANASKQLAKMFFQRVRDKSSWVSSWGTDKTETNEGMIRKNKSVLSECILREYIRKTIRSLSHVNY